MLGLSCCSLTFQRKRENERKNCAKINSLVRFLRRGEESGGENYGLFFDADADFFAWFITSWSVRIYSIATRHSSQPSFSLSFLSEFLISIKILLSVTTQLCAASAKKSIKEKNSFDLCNYHMLEKRVERKRAPHQLKTASSLSVF